MRLQAIRAHKKVILAFLIVVIVIVLGATSSHQNMDFPAQASGNALYVSPDGSDTNDGSQAHPFATIQKAANSVTPGTTVHVLPGIYTQPVTITTSGTANARIIFVSDTKWGAKIKTTSTADIWTTQADYVDIVGFEMTSTAASTAIENLGSYLRTIGNYVHDIPGGPCNDIGGTGIDEQNYAAHDNDIIGNIVAHVGNYPTACDYTHGIYIATPRGHVYNNIAYNNVGNGIYTNHAATGTIIANNLSFANAEYGIGINTVPAQSGGGDNFLVANNIVVENGMYGINTWSSANGAHNQYLHNLFYQNKLGTYSLDHSSWSNANQQGTITADPQFINYQADGSGDYHVQATSPAIDAGVSQDAPSTDFDGNQRSSSLGYSIGPYEYIGSSGTTSTPITVPSVTPTSTPTTVPSVTPTSTPTTVPSVTPTSLPPDQSSNPTGSAIIDATSTFVERQNVDNFTWNHGIGPQNNELLIVQIVTSSASNHVSSVQYNGSSLASLAAVNCGASCRDEVWYMLNPDPGTHAITVQTSNSAPVTATAISFSNVNQTAPFGTVVSTRGTGTASNLTIPAQTAQVVIDFYGNQATIPFVPTSGDQQEQQVNVGNTIAQEAAISTASAMATSTPMTWHWSRPNGYADIGVAIQ